MHRRWTMVRALVQVDRPAFFLGGEMYRTPILASPGDAQHGNHGTQIPRASNLGMHNYCGLARRLVLDRFLQSCDDHRVDLELRNVYHDLRATFRVNPNLDLVWLLEFRLVTSEREFHAITPEELAAV